jgi:hypothetical protein
VCPKTPVPRSTPTASTTTASPPAPISIDRLRAVTRPACAATSRSSKDAGGGSATTARNRSASLSSSTRVTSFVLSL